MAWPTATALCCGCLATTRAYSAWTAGLQRAALRAAIHRWRRTSGSLGLHVAIIGSGDTTGDTRPRSRPMSRRKKDPLRQLSDEERDALTQLSRSQAAPAAHVA